jgi:putative membrane protein
MWDHAWGMQGLGMIFGPITMIAALVAIIIVVVLLTRWLGGNSSLTQPYQGMQKTPLDILKERLARGEIDTQEFEEKKRLLSS